MQFKRKIYYNLTKSMHAVLYLITQIFTRNFIVAKMHKITLSFLLLGFLSGNKFVSFSLVSSGTQRIPNIPVSKIIVTSCFHAKVNLS